MSKVKKLTGKEWAKKYDINIVDFAGFSSLDEFNTQLINKETFLLRASQCTLSEPLEKSRRIVHDFKYKLYNA